MVFGLFKKKPSDWKGEGEYEKMWEGKEKRLEKTAKRLEKEEVISLTVMKPYNGDQSEGRISSDTQKELHVRAYSGEDVAEDETRSRNGDVIEIKGNSNRWISVDCGQLFPNEPNYIIRIDDVTQGELGVKVGDTVNVRKR